MAVREKHRVGAIDAAIDQADRGRAGGRRLAFAGRSARRRMRRAGRAAALVHVVEVVHAVRVERAQARQHGGGVFAGRHAQHHQRLVQAAKDGRAQRRQAGRARRRQRRRAGRPGQDLMPARRRAARIGLEQVGVAPQQGAGLVQAQAAQVLDQAVVQQALWTAQQFAVERAYALRQG